MEIIVTGGTGILGKKLIVSLFNQTNIEKIYLLVRDVVSAKLMFKSIIDIQSNKLVFLEGEITQELCGLSEKDIQSLHNVRKCYHLAACVHLGHSEKVKQIVHQVNVNGTKNILTLLKSSTTIQEVVYVSSAYSCGITSEIVGDNFKNKPEEFRNPYEESKWNAENLLKNELSDTDISFAVVRPGILLSPDLMNQRLSTHTIYLFSNIIYKFSKLGQERIRLLGDSVASLNFVFIEDLVKYLVNIEVHNQSLNFVAEESIRIDELLKTISEGLSLTELYTFTANKVNDFSDVEFQINSILEPFQPYFIENGIEWKRNILMEDLKSMNFHLKNKDEILKNIKLYCEMMRKNDERKLSN